MPIIAENPENKLVQNIDSLRSDMSRWGLAILNGSSMDAALQRMLKDADSRLEIVALTRDAGMVVYCCYDADVAVLYNGTFSENWPVLEQVVREMLPHLRPDDIDFSSLFTSYDFMMEFEAALSWAKAKQEKAKQAIKEAKDSVPQEAAWDSIAFNDAMRARSGRKKKLVAIAEDNQSMRQLARNVLRTEYDVVMASNGLEALELYNVCAPDLLFLDIQMPHMDGVEVLERIMKADPDARAVMFSTHSSEIMLKKAMERGAKGFVVKPFTAQALMQYAGQALKP